MLLNFLCIVKRNSDYGPYIWYNCNVWMFVKKLRPILKCQSIYSMIVKNQTNIKTFKI